MKPEEDNSSKLATLVKNINASFGDRAIMKLGDATGMEIETISTGALTLDLALGGGLPKGRIVEIYGDTGSAKTSLALHAIAESQKNGDKVAFIDTEYALDPTYAKAIGVDVDEMFISQPSSAEESLEILIKLVESNMFGIVVVDSVAALVPRAELEGEVGDSHMGLIARMMSQTMRKLTAILGKSKCVVIFINQERALIATGGYGPRLTTTGGNALKFYASIRIDATRIQTLKKGNDEYGIRIKAKVVKNKVAAPFKVGEYDVIFGQGISQLGCLVDLAETNGIVIRKGAWYSYNGENISQGRDNLVKTLEADPAMAKEMKAKVMLAIKPFVNEKGVVEVEEV